MSVAVSQTTTPHMCVKSRTRIPQLTPDSQQLLSYIERQSRKSTFRFTNTTKQCITRLCERIHGSYLHIPPYSMENILPNKMDTFMSEFAKSKTNYIPEIIFDSILSSEKIGRRIHLKIHHREIAIHLILPKPENTHTKHTAEYSRIFTSEKHADRFFHDCARRIITWLHVALPFSGKKCTNTLQCYMFLTHHTKLLPKSVQTNYDTREHIHTPITREHANTAFTWACVPHSDIVVFRMEEWFKVLIHETFHTLGLDFSEMDTTESNKQISRIFGGCSPTTDFRIYESYCEVWAETINAIYVAYLSEYRICFSPIMTTQKRRKPRVASSAKTHNHRGRTLRAWHTHITPIRMRNIIRKIEICIQNERCFSLFQMAKVLHHHHLTYHDLCPTPENAHLNRRKYTEETQVFSYYILKTILLFHLNDFIEWCTEHNDSLTESATLGKTPVIHGATRFGLYFHKTHDTILEYVRLIERLHKMSEFIKCIDTETEQYSRNHLKIHPLIRNTMRMSLYEMRSILA